MSYRRSARVTRLLGVLGLLAAASLFAGCSDDLQPVKRLKLAHSLDTGHPVHQAMEFMAAELDRLSAGSMRLEIHPSGQLGSERELIELLQIGSLAMTKVSASPLEGFAPEMKVFSVPYVFRDRTTTGASWTAVGARTCC